MYPVCWTTSKRGIFMRYSYELKKNVLNCTVKASGWKLQKLWKNI